MVAAATNNITPAIIHFIFFIFIYSFLAARFLCFVLS